MATILDYGIGNSTNVDESQKTDNSKAFGGVQNATEDQLGSNISLSDVNGVTLTLSDEGAVAAGRDIALRGLDTGAASLQALASTAQEISKRGFDLAAQAAAGQGGQLIKGVLILAAVLAGAWGVAEYLKTRKG